ncbi:hypothetical protein EJ04DRAFT_528909 [Polyplosphaeria fusca]|uniref:Nephrocystin 3-like N-terminal domain-containing protein n=1 Tax=Polyplosphaeria fusca TaxID=682080 RepID=A0A9P4UXE6_9PLEO|nr:hypothetical protein EJ04DRAFT_528909 [Polyplosphaeria fusca]
MCNTLETILLWGTFRFVLQASPYLSLTGTLSNSFKLASNYTTFFEKLLRTLHQLATEFPPYEELTNGCSSIQRRIDDINPAILKGIGSLYASLFCFLRCVLQVFRKEDRTPKRIFGVAASISWEPFDHWFGDLLQGIEINCQPVKAQIEVYICHGIKGICKTDSKLLDSQRDMEHMVKKMVEREFDAAQHFHYNTRASTIMRLRQWIHPPEFTLEFESAQANCEEGTAEWLFSDSTFSAWKNRDFLNDLSAPEDMVLWVHGNPGSGKTILAASTVQELRSNPDDNACYFFFRANGPKYKKSEHAYQSILAQTLQFYCHDTSVLDKFTFILKEDSSGQSKISVQEALDLLKLLALEGYIQYILLDAIDECTDWNRLLHPSSGLPAFLYQTPAKLILFSRPHIEASLFQGAR